MDYAFRSYHHGIYRPVLHSHGQWIEQDPGGGAMGYVQAAGNVSTWI